LSDEIEMLRNYIDLEKMRDPVRFDYSIEINDKSEINFIQIPPMLIQPFIENSIKHGFNNLDKKGVLKINIEDKTEWVEFVIEDNGNGIRESDLQQKKHQSMAMNIFEKRRKLIQQKHKKEFRFEIENLNDTNPKIRGVKITLNIPVLNND
jgi:LytS/YehU family sensor histidine kinase